MLVRFMLSDGLRDEGYHVIEACDADEALAILETVTPDLIISDVRMPGSVNGLGLLALIRKSLPSLPVIIMSGHLHPEVALADGAVQFIAKPFLMESITRAARVELAKAL